MYPYSANIRHKTSKSALVQFSIPNRTKLRPPPTADYSYSYSFLRVQEEAVSFRHHHPCQTAGTADDHHMTSSSPPESPCCPATPPMRTPLVVILPTFASTLLGARYDMTRCFAKVANVVPGATKDATSTLHLPLVGVDYRNPVVPQCPRGQRFPYMGW